MEIRGRIDNLIFVADLKKMYKIEAEEQHQEVKYNDQHAQTDTIQKLARQDMQAEADKAAEEDALDQ